MAANFTLCMPVEKSILNSNQPVLDGAFLETQDQAPTGSWAEVDFDDALAAQAAREVGGALIHISTDVALRYRVQAAEPAGGDAGGQVLANVERTIGIALGQKLWIK